MENGLIVAQPMYEKHPKNLDTYINLFQWKKSDQKLGTDHVHISVGIPSCNERRTLLRLLDNIEHQKLDHNTEIIEVIISDDSSDNTPQLIKEYLSSNKHKIPIRLLHHQERRGTAAAWNEIMGEARGEIIILFDADVLIHSTTAKFLTEPFFNNRQVGLVSSNIIPLKPRTYNGGASYLVGKLLTALRLSHPTNQLTIQGRGLALKKEMANLSPIPSQTIAIDLYLTCRALELNYRVICAEKAVTYFQPSETFREFASQAVRAFIGHRQLHQYEKKALHKRIRFIEQLWEMIRISKDHPKETTALILALALLPVNLPYVLRGASSHIWDIALTSKITTGI